RSIFRTATFFTVSLHRLSDQDSAFPDALQICAEVLAELGMPQRVLDRCAQVADLAAAVVTPAVEGPDVDWLVGEQRGDAVSELNLAAGAAPGALELLEARGRPHVAGDDRETRRR